MHTLWSGSKPQPHSHFQSSIASPLRIVLPDSEDAHHHPRRSPPECGTPNVGADTHLHDGCKSTFCHFHLLPEQKDRSSCLRDRDKGRTCLVSCASRVPYVCLPCTSDSPRVYPCLVCHVRPVCVTCLVCLVCRMSCASCTECVPCVFVCPVCRVCPACTRVCPVCRVCPVRRVPSAMCVHVPPCRVYPVCTSVCPVCHVYPVCVPCVSCDGTSTPRLRARGTGSWCRRDLEVTTP